MLKMTHEMAEVGDFMSRHTRSACITTRCDILHMHRSCANARSQTLRSRILFYSTVRCVDLWHRLRCLANTMQAESPLWFECNARIRLTQDVIDL